MRWMLGGGVAKAISTVKTALGVMDGEVVEAKATDVVARAELISDLNFVFVTSFVGLFLPWSCKL